MTDRQGEILAFIRQYISGNGYPPTVREIGTAFGIKSTNGVADHLRYLERRGLIGRSGLKARGIRLTAAKPKMHFKIRLPNGSVIECDTAEEALALANARQPAQRGA